MTTLQVVLKRAVEDRGWALRELERQTEIAAQVTGIRKQKVAFSVINYALNAEGSMPDMVNLYLIVQALNLHPTAPKVSLRRALDAAGFPVDMTEPDRHLEERIKGILRALENDLDFVERIAGLPLSEREEVRRYIDFRTGEREEEEREEIKRYIEFRRQRSKG